MAIRDRFVFKKGSFEESLHIVGIKIDLCREITNDELQIFCGRFLPRYVLFIARPGRNIYLCAQVEYFPSEGEGEISIRDLSING